MWMQIVIRMQAIYAENIYIVMAKYCQLADDADPIWI